jgi:predicted MFS family arabinose efflux permease
VGPSSSKLTRLRAPLRYRDFRLLWYAQVASELGDWAARLALAVLVQQKTGSAVLTTLVTSASVLPYLGLGQWLATLADRRPRAQVVIATDLVRAVVFAAMTIDQPVGVLLVLAFIAGTAAPVFEAARGGITPATVPSDRYGDAIALAQITFQASVLVGYAAGGGLAATIGPRAALLVNAASFALSAAMFARMRVGRDRPLPEARPIRLGDGWRAIVEDPYVRRFLVTCTAVGSCTVVGQSLVAVYAPDEFGAGPSTVGVLAAAMPLGAIAATVVSRGSGSDTRQLERASVVALVGALAGGLLFVVGTSLAIAFAGFAMIGVANASVVPGNEVAVLRLPDRCRATAISIVQGFMMGSQALAAALGGLIARSAGARTTIASALAAATVVSAWGALLPPRQLRHARGVQPTAVTLRPIEGVRSRRSVASASTGRPNR